MSGTRLALSKFPQVIVGRQLRNFPTRKPNFDSLPHEAKFFQDPRVHAVFREFFFEMPNARQELSVFEGPV